MTIIEADGFFSAFLKQRRFALIPQWILFSLDISKPMKDIRKSFDNESTHNNLRKMRRYNYSYEVIRDPAKFDLFYREMYLPYAEKRFGDASLIISRRQMKRVLNKGWLLLVKRDNEVLGGSILKDYEKTCLAHSLGLKDGNIKYLEQGVLTAAYYFIIHWAKDAGFERIDFGYCRPFLRDGIIIYKKRWGMEVQKHDGAMGRGVMGIKFNAFSKAVRRFISGNPFVLKDGEELRGLISAQGNQSLTSEGLQLLMRIHDLKGLDGMMIINPQGFTQEAQKWAALSFPQKLHLVHMDIEPFFQSLTDQRINKKGNFDNFKGNAPL